MLINIREFHSDLTKFVVWCILDQIIHSQTNILSRKIMNSRGSSILGRASSSEGSTSNQDESDFDQSFKSENHFFDAIKKTSEISHILHESHNLSTHVEHCLQTPVDLM